MNATLTQDKSESARHFVDFTLEIPDSNVNIWHHPLNKFMEIIKQLLDFFIHLDHHLTALVQDFGVWTYLILFLIIFCETGLVVTPFLPGDSLLFAIGALAAGGGLNVAWCLGLLIAAAILGDTVNYAIGHVLAPRIFRNEKIKFLNEKHLQRTQEFYAKYGGKTIIFARFLPIIRTFAPFLAGVGTMSYPRFLLYNVVGAVLWVTGFVLAGYFFGNLPIVKENFTFVIFAIIIISIIPALVEFYKSRKNQSV